MSSPHYDPENGEQVGVTLEGAHIIPYALENTKSGEDDEDVNLPTFPFLSYRDTSDSKFGMRLTFSLGRTYSRPCMDQK